MAHRASMQEIVFPDSDNRTRTILIVEDEYLIRIALSEYLQEHGFKVVESGRADQAIEIIRNSDGMIDLVFSDVVMPGKMDGFGLAQWVRSNRPGLPIILTSGNARKIASAKELCESEPFLAKPYDLKHVVAQIHAVIEAAKTNAP